MFDIAHMYSATSCFLYPRLHFSLGSWVWIQTQRRQLMEEPGWASSGSDYWSICRSQPKANRCLSNYQVHTMVNIHQ